MSAISVISEVCIRHTVSGKEQNPLPSQTANFLLSVTKVICRRPLKGYRLTKQSTINMKYLFLSYLQNLYPNQK